jgi:hypothetical protein
MCANRVVAKFLSAPVCCLGKLLSDDVNVCPGVEEMCVGTVCLLVNSGGRRQRILTDHSQKSCNGLKVGSKSINPFTSQLYILYIYCTYCTFSLYILNCN